MAKGLTTRQEGILQFLIEYSQREGYPPSIREIGKRFDIGSLRGVTVHLDALERKGYISRANTPRSIKVIHADYQQSNQVTMLPLLGTIAAGVPIQANQDVEEMIPVPAQMVRNVDHPFLLRIRGDSMIEEGIFERDLVVIKPQPTANQNDLVAAMIDDEATVKRIKFQHDKVHLMPANAAYSPIIADRDATTIIGRVIGLLRDYDGKSF